MQGHYKNCLDPTVCWCEVRGISKVLLIALVIVAVQITAGTISGSLALLADAGHTAMDSVAYSVVLIATILIRFGTYTSRVRDVAFYINIGLLFLVVVWILIQAVKHFNEPGEVGGALMILGAAIGGCLNYIQHKVLQGVPDVYKNDSHESNSLHVLQDMGTSIGVVLGGIIIVAGGPTIVDPLLSVVVAVLTFYGITRLLYKRYKRKRSETI